MRRRITIAAVAAAAALAIGLSGCTGAPTGGSSKSGTHYVTINGGAPFTRNFNPFSPTAATGTQALYETLFFANSRREAGAKLQPVLATDYRFSDNASTLVLHTRKGVNWHDGKSFGPQDVAFTFNYLTQHPEINAQGFSGSAKVTGPDEVTVTFGKPGLVKALNLLATQVIIPEHIWSGISNPSTVTNDKGIGTGPFVPGQFTDQTYTLDANHDYWEKGKPQVDGLRVINAAANDAVVDQLLDGKLDWTGITYPQADKVLAANPDIRNTGTITGQLSFATCSNAQLGCKGPQTDPAVRRAIYLALDRSQLNSLAFSGTAGEISPTYAILPRDKNRISPSISQPIAPAKGDAQAAADMLKKAGYARGTDGIFQKDGVRLSLTAESVQGWSDWQSAVNTSVEQLKAAGIELVPHFVSASAWGTDASQGNYQLIVWNIGSSTLVEPYGLYSSSFATAATARVGEQTPGTNYSRYSNPIVDAAVGVLANTDDASVQAQQYAIIQKEIVRDMPNIPIVGYTNWSQWNTGKYGNWPTDDNAYAGKFFWMNPDFEIVLKNLTVNK